MSMLSSTSVRFVGVACVALIAASPAHASNPTGQCQKGRLKMSGKYAACLASADAGFAQKPDTARRDDARAKCDTKMQGLWSKKTGQFGAVECGGLWDDVDVRTWLGSCNDSLVAGITTNFDIRPSLDCIDRNNDGSITAYFGYENRQAGAVVVPAGTNNGLTTAGLDAGQPTTFQPGVVGRAFALRFRGHATWTVGGRSVSADHHSPLCAMQPATPTPCEAELRSTFLNLEGASDVSIAQLRAAYDAALALARAGLASAAPGGTASTASFPRAVGSCGTIIDQAVTSLGQSLTLAQQNSLQVQNQLIAVLNATAASAATAATGRLEARSAALTATVPGTPISADAFGDFEEWATSVLADYLNEAALTHVDFATGVLEVTAAHGTILDGTAPGAPAAASPFSFPRSIVSDDIDASSVSLATGALQALAISGQNLIVSHQQLDTVLIAALTQTSSAILGGKALYRGTLEQARDPRRFLSQNPEVADLTLPTFAAVDPAVAASADAFFQLAQANNRGFRSSLALLSETHVDLAARILSLVQSSATPPMSALAPARGVLRTAGFPRVVDPAADPADVALANLIASFAQSTNLQMQNEVFGQYNQLQTNQAALTQQINDWLALP